MFTCLNYYWRKCMSSRSSFHYFAWFSRPHLDFGPTLNTYRVEYHKLTSDCVQQRFQYNHTGAVWFYIITCAHVLRDDWWRIEWNYTSIRITLAEYSNQNIILLMHTCSNTNDRALKRLFVWVSSFVSYIFVQWWERHWLVNDDADLFLVIHDQPKRC